MGTNEALKELYQVNVKICFPFVEAVTETLKTQCGIEAKVGKPLFKEPQLEDRTDVIISAGLGTDTSVTSLAICMSRKVFLNIMGKMMRQTFHEISPLLEDGARELMNIIFNLAKKPLAQKGFSAVRIVPQIVFGTDMKVRYLTRGRPVILPFDSTAGPFIIEIMGQEMTTSDTVGTIR